MKESATQKKSSEPLSDAQIIRRQIFVVLAVAGVLCWTKVSSKGGVTAATIAALIGVMQLLLALHLFK